MSSHASSTSSAGEAFPGGPALGPALAKPSARLPGVTWPEVTAQAAHALANLCRHPPNRDLVLEALSLDGSTMGLGALVKLLRAGALSPVPHEGITADAIS